MLGAGALWGHAGHWPWERSGLLVRGAGRGHSFGVRTGGKGTLLSKPGVETSSLHQCCLGAGRAQERELTKGLKKPRLTWAQRGRAHRQMGVQEEVAKVGTEGPGKEVNSKGLTEWNGDGLRGRAGPAVCAGRWGAPCVLHLDECGVPAVARPAPQATSTEK